ncbi:16S rRNA pseudouridine(516) synthase [Sutterella sp.]|uniref:16S rRNA pseudouridine(516) synthase n=1 Tax=Sutterella sp. TaxID=1981025 RepID=UPI0025DB1C07|nr:16S rRNA pseudouridine(516) synthase [uncultured Sutterella sp.]
MKTLADILFSQGFGTRYDCRQTVLSGAVSIGGTACMDPDQTFDPEGLELVWRGQVWPVREKVVIAMNKPAGYECSMKPSAHPSVMGLLPGPLRKRGVQPVGRLDWDTTGLLIFTDDGALLHRLTHPKKHVEKVYVARLCRPLTDADCAKLMAGVVLDDDPKPVAAKSARMLAPNVLELVISQGKYHQVKRMVAACGSRVAALHRIRVGAYSLPEDLAPGEWRWLDGAQTLLGGGAR